MTPSSVGFIGIFLLVVLLFSGMPLGFVMGLVGFLGFAYLNSLDAALALLGSVPYSTFSDYGFSVLPLFMLMGTFLYVARISSDLYDTAYKWVGHYPGGLAMSTIAACGGFAAMCGSSTATAAAIGIAVLPEMKRYRYSLELATGCVACGGTLGVMIPPSIILIIYGIIAQESIGKLFIAGIFPGILQVLILIATVYVICKRNPAAGPAGPRASFRERIISLKNIWVMLILFAGVMGGIYMGFFSPTEAGGVGCFGAFAFAMGRRRLHWKGFVEAIYETARITSMTFIIIAGAQIFSRFIAVSRLPVELSTLISEMQLNGYVVIALILFLYLVLGCIMDTIAMMLFTVPIFLPLILSYGFDPIWFGIIATLMAEIALITPPVGINVFVIKGVANVPMYTIFRGVSVFILAMLVLLIFLIIFPQISLFLPSAMK
jgi:C4-dicarboxylate transporter DctM subunit